MTSMPHNPSFPHGGRFYLLLFTRYVADSDAAKYYVSSYIHTESMMNNN